MRDIDRKETIEVEMELEKEVGELKKELERMCRLNMDHLLFYRDVELSEEKPLKFYGLEEDDLLVLQRDQGTDSSLREDFPEDQERISRGKRWLERNIGLDTSELELSEYLKTDHGRTEMILEQDDSKYKLELSEERIEEYDVFSERG